MKNIYLFHGLNDKSIESQPLAPFFMTSSRDAAHNYSNSGKVVVVATKAEDFMDFSDNDKKLIDFLAPTGVEIQEVPFFYCGDITHHSRHDGTNVVDLAYLPELQSLVLANGYKGVKLTDMQYNKSFFTYVLFDTSECEVLEKVPEEVA